MKKFTALLLIFSLMAISCATMTTQRQKRFESSKERKRGATLIITKKDGRQIEGELITVKPNSLLLLNTEGKDVSIDIADIRAIRIVKKSKALLGAGLGFLVGGGIGAAVGGLIKQATWLDGIVEICAVIGGLFCGIFGISAGASAGKDKTIQIEGMTDFKIQETMDKLRKKARIPDYN